MKELNSLTDEQLALLYVQGNNRAFDILLKRNQTKLFSYILFVIRDEEKANDVFQETFVKAITKLHESKYADTGKFSAWLMRIAHNVIMDSFRSNKNKHIVDTDPENDLSNISSAQLQDGNIENRYVNEQILRDVRKLMDFLPTSQRELVYMRFYQEMSFKEIADTTGVSINTSLGRMRYAILNMRRLAKANNVALEM